MSRTAAFAAIAALGAAFLAATGFWPFFDAKSFYDEVAPFPPYNPHFLHDVGAFQIGLAATLVAGILWQRDGLLAALAGTGIGAAFHFAAHVADSDLEGARHGQTALLGAFAAIILAAAVWRWMGRVES